VNKNLAIMFQKWKILNVNKPAGPDGVSPRLLKDIAYSISKPLTTFFMDLAILHHFPVGISLIKSSEVSLFLYSSFAFLTKSITSFLINYNAADIEGLADELNITNWHDLVFDSDNINDVYSN
jgi:hypothetical protein